MLLGVFLDVLARTGNAWRVSADEKKFRLAPTHQSIFRAAQKIKAVILERLKVVVQGSEQTFKLNP